MPSPSRFCVDTDEPRGCAFVEFPDRDSLSYGLNLHKAEVNGRRINVELTAGGGGTGDKRKHKIAERRQRVALQRVAKMQRTTAKTAEAGAGAAAGAGAGAGAAGKESATTEKKRTRKESRREEEDD